MFVQVEKNSDQVLFIRITYNVSETYTIGQNYGFQTKQVLKEFWRSLSLNKRNYLWQPFFVSYYSLFPSSFFKDVESLRFFLLIGVNLPCNTPEIRKEFVLLQKKKENKCTKDSYKKYVLSKSWNYMSLTHFKKKVTVGDIRNFIPLVEQTKLPLYCYLDSLPFRTMFHLFEIIKWVTPPK